MDVALKLFPADYWRWWLLSNAPESSDSNFTWDSFQNTINKDCLLYTSPSPRDRTRSRMPSSA